MLHLWAQISMDLCYHTDTQVVLLTDTISIDRALYAQARSFIYSPTGPGLLTGLASAADFEAAALARLVGRASLTAQECQQLRTFLLQVLSSIQLMSSRHSQRVLQD